MNLREIFIKILVGAFLNPFSLLVLFVIFCWKFLEFSFWLRDFLAPFPIVNYIGAGIVILIFALGILNYFYSIGEDIILEHGWGERLGLKKE